MKPSLLVLRPEPGAHATARRAAALGWRTVLAPLFGVTPLEWTAADAARYDAVMMTSANAARLGGANLAALHALPLYAVGEATAAAARAAGFRDIRPGSADATALVEMIAADGRASLLHLAGREHRAPSHPDIRMERAIVYAAEPVDRLPDTARAALRDGAIALLHSPRAAGLFAALADAAALPRVGQRIAAISPAALAAAGGGWGGAIAAASPDDAALLAAAARLCE